jgi:hypothetical protein
MYRYYSVTRLYKAHTFVFTKHSDHEGYVSEPEAAIAITLDVLLVEATTNPCFSLLFPRAQTTAQYSLRFVTAAKNCSNQLTPWSRVVLEKPPVV